MKKKKGFTLIELLAIIIILAVIAVITTPIILGIIDDAKNNSAINSAYGYIDSVHKGYMVGTTDNSENTLPKGQFIINNDGKPAKNESVLAANISGQSPSEGWIHIEKGQIVAYSLKFGDYVVTKYKDTNPTAVKNGEIAENPELGDPRIEVTKQGDTIATGDTVKLKLQNSTEQFIILKDDPRAPSGTTALLAENNLNPSTGYQGPNGNWYTYPVAFAGTQYWTSWSTDIYDSSKNASSGDNYSVAYHVQTYVNNLINDGFNIHSGRILTKAEVMSGGIAATYMQSEEEYWLATAGNNSCVSGVFPNGNSSDAYSYVTMYDFGVRPLIYISTDDLLYAS